MDSMMRDANRQADSALKSIRFSTMAGPLPPSGVWPLLDRFNKLKRWQRRVIVVTVTLIIGGIDYLSGYEASVASLYVVPVFLAGWSIGLADGLVLAVLASATIVLSNLFAGLAYSATWLIVWNIVLRSGTFAALAVLASSLRNEMERAYRLSLTDSLTGAWNRRAFYQAVERELSRAKRNDAPFAVAYIDLDDFKAINDQFGHQTGDEVLKAVVSTCVKTLRIQDTVARLGGDEFAILMPDTDESATRALLNRLVKEVKSKTWTVSRVGFSIGAITFEAVPHSTDAALHQVDQLMYSAKSAGKGRIVFQRYPARP